MERLPVELQYKIFSQLEFRDKYKCLFVSKQWNKYIKCTCLFSQVNFYNNNFEKLKLAVAYFEKYPERAKQTVKITIETKSNIKEYISLLSTIFPNAKYISIRHDNYCQQDAQLLELIEPRMKNNTWKKMIELNIIENIQEDTTLLALQNLMPFECQTLTHLDLRAGANKVLMDQKSLDCIKNASCLETLVLKNLWFEVQDFDSAINSLPRLKSVTFISCELNTENQQPLTILKTNKPKQLEKLNITFQDSYALLADTAKSDFVEFALTRFTGFQSFSLVFHSLFTYEEEDLDAIDAIQDALLPYIPQWPNLQSYGVSLPINETIMDKIDKSNIKLKHVTIYIDHTQPEDQFTILTDSEQHKSIEKMDIIITNQADSTMLPINGITIMQELQVFEKLTHIDIFVEQFYHSIDLLFISDCLNYLKCLESINLDRAKVTGVPLHQPFYSQLANSVYRLKHFNLKLSATEYLELNTVNQYMGDLLNACLELETFELRLTDHINYRKEVAYFQRRELPYTLKLDFRRQERLKFINVFESNDFVVKNRCYFYIISPITMGFFSLNTKDKKALDDISFEMFYTTVYLSKPIHVNQLFV